MNLTSVVPLTPSNVGVFQAACIAVLHPFRVDPSRALAYGLILQAVEIFDALVLGTLALLREGIHWSDLRRHAQLGRAGGRRELTYETKAGRRHGAGGRLRAGGRLSLRRPGA